MTISNQTQKQLGIALTPDVIDYILQDDRWIDFLHEMIPDAITETMGNVDHNLLYELGMIVMDNISVKPLYLMPPVEVSQ